MKKRTARLIWIVILLLGTSGAVALALAGLSRYTQFFFTPSQLAAQNLDLDRPIRLGGVVEEESITLGEDEILSFVITDYENTITVRYRGIVPSLFAEGRGAVVEGRLDAQGVFVAEKILAKHDENYMPPEIAENLRRMPAQQDRNPALPSGSLLPSDQTSPESY